MRHAPALLLLILVVSISPLNALAQWQVDGVPICTADSIQYSPTIVSDGAGGAIVTWQDGRSGTNDIYVQRVNAAGVPLWPANGVALCTAANEQSDPIIVSDGAGGAIVTWQDYRSGTNWDIYARRVSNLGVPRWTANGVAVCTVIMHQQHPKIVSDGLGGAIVTWQDMRPSGVSSDVYAQRLNSTGTPQWAANGVALCIAANNQIDPTIATDGAGGAIVTWQDGRSGTNVDIYAQRVNISGTPQWTADGVALCSDASNIDYPTIASDGAGGAIVTWQDYRSGPNSDIYAQRVDAAGVPQWTADGVALSTAVFDQFFPTIVSDGAQGAIVAWTDYQSDPGFGDIYAQRVNVSGVPQWSANGVALCSAAYRQAAPMIVSDGAGGAIVAWYDLRSGPGSDIYAQRVNASGSSQWGENGVALCTAANDQAVYTIVSDGAQGAIVTWSDYRSGADSDIYAQHVADAPNAVAIMSFDAAEANGVVTLRSAFRSELHVGSVNVYRGSADDPLKIIERSNDIRGDGFAYVDRNVAPGQTYRYQIGVVDADGEFFSPIVTVSVKAVSGELSQNTPNPFNPTTTIRFVLPTREDVTLAIYDSNGRLVRTLVNEVQSYGAHEVTWDGRDDAGATVGSGVYFYRLHAGKFTESKKMVLLK